MKKDEDDEDDDLTNADLVRTVAEKSNVVTFFCKYCLMVINGLMLYQNLPPAKSFMINKILCASIFH